MSIVDIGEGVFLSIFVLLAIFAMVKVLFFDN